MLRRRPKGPRYSAEEPERSSIVLDSGPHGALGDGRQKRLMVLFYVIRVGLREPRHGTVELLAAPQTPSDLRRWRPGHASPHQAENTLSGRRQYCEKLANGERALRWMPAQQKRPAIWRAVALMVEMGGFEPPSRTAGR